MAMLNRTLLIGLGGTGIDVLRRFKTYHVQTTSPENREHIRLLGIDTIQQTTEGPERLAQHEFVHLAKAAISNLTIQKHAYLPRFQEVAKAGLPAFNVHEGAGQKRLAGYLAYLWDGEEVVRRIESALSDLYRPEINARFVGDQTVGATRVFVISSVCGGTGTGMFLDVSYLVRDMFRRKQLEARYFGMLFLPSAFPTLMANPSAARGVRANGLAALEELNFYMQESRRENATLPAPGDHARIPATGRVFDRCFLIGGQTESGHLVGDVDQLYKRTANFLFTCIAFTPVVSKLVEHYVTNPNGNYAGIGSFTLPLPQSKFTEKYTVTMGREMLGDLLAGDSVQAISLDDFLARTRFPEAEALDRSPLMDEAHRRLDQEVFNFGTPASHDQAQQQMHAMHEQAQRIINETRSRAGDQARAILQDVIRKLDDGVGLPDEITRGVLSARVNLLRSLAQRLSSLSAQGGNANTESVTSILEQAVKAPGLFNKSKPESRIAQYKTALAGAYIDDIKAILQGELRGEAERVRGTVLDEISKLSNVIAGATKAFEDFRKESEDFLRMRKSSDVGEALADTEMGKDVAIDDRYQESRMALLNICRSEIRVYDILKNSHLDLKGFLQRLYVIAGSWVKDKVTLSQALDSDAFARGLNSAWVSLQLTPRPNGAVTSLNMLFYPGDEQVKTQIAERLQQWPGANDGETDYAAMENSSVVTLIRLRHGFHLGDVQEIDELTQAYRDVLKDDQRGPFLRIPTHMREPLQYDDRLKEQSRTFAIALALGVIKEFGQNFKFNGRTLLPEDVEDKVERRQRAYERMLQAENRIVVEKVRDGRLEDLGNRKFAASLQEQASAFYADPTGVPEYRELLIAEQQNLQAYCESIG